jgi:hypothetical protein
MLGKKELTYLECDLCGRIYLYKDADPKVVLSRARDAGWECPPVNQKERFGDTCPKCRPPSEDTVILPKRPPMGAMPAELPDGGIVDMRKVISGVLVEEVGPGLTAAEEIARVVVQGALAGDKGMIRVLTETGGAHNEAQCATAATD